MQKLTYKLILAITICTLTVAMIVGGISLYSTTTIMTRESKDKLLMGTEKYANEFSAIFNRTEALVDALAANITVTFDGEAYKKDHGYVDFYKEYLDGIIKQTLVETPVTQGLFMTFNPEINNPYDEVWYGRDNGEIVNVKADPSTLVRDFSLPAKDNMLYFFKPIWEKKGVWVPPYYDGDLDLNVISYSRAVYYEDIFIGVVGADVLTAETTDIVESMKLYPSGHAFLLNEKMGFIVDPTHGAGEKLKDLDNQGELSLKEQIQKGKAGIIDYHLDGKGKTMGFSRLDNGWTLAITQPNTEVFAPIKTLQLIMAALGTVVFFATIIFASVFSMAFSKPIVKEKGELEEKNREKDIMLTYQSRQAKMGEMVGNIAHQWKQPLNSMNLILVNLLDAYRYGELDEKKLESSVDKADKIVKKLVETVGDFTDFLKPSKEKVQFDVNEAIDLALNLMEESIVYNKIKVDFLNEEILESFGYPNEFSHVVFNILNNARDAAMVCIEGERLITILSEKRGEQIIVEITNRGEAIEEENLQKVFDPYFTTKGDKEGTGLGLYMCKNIVEQRMDGTIEMKNMEQGVSCIVCIHEGRYGGES